MKAAVHGRVLASALVLAFAPVLLYASGYAFARATHRLVWYGSFVARPGVTSGIGWTRWELAFAPLCWAEAELRR